MTPVTEEISRARDRILEACAGGGEGVSVEELRRQVMDGFDSLRELVASQTGEVKARLDQVSDLVSSLTERVIRLEERSSGRSQQIATLERNLIVRLEAHEREQQRELAEIREDHKTLSGRLWALAAGLILAVIGGVVALLTGGGGK